MERAFWFHPNSPPGARQEREGGETNTILNVNYNWKERKSKFKPYPDSISKGYQMETTKGEIKICFLGAKVVKGPSWLPLKKPFCLFGWLVGFLPFNVPRRLTNEDMPLYSKGPWGTCLSKRGSYHTARILEAKWDPPSGKNLWVRRGGWQSWLQEEKQYQENPFLFLNVLEHRVLLNAPLKLQTPVLACIGLWPLSFTQWCSNSSVPQSHLEGLLNTQIARLYPSGFLIL